MGRQRVPVPQDPAGPVSGTHRVRPLLLAAQLLQRLRQLSLQDRQTDRQTVGSGASPRRCRPPSERCPGRGRGGGAGERRPAGGASICDRGPHTRQDSSCPVRATRAARCRRQAHTADTRQSRSGTLGVTGPCWPDRRTARPLVAMWREPGDSHPRASHTGARTQRPRAPAPWGSDRPLCPTRAAGWRVPQVLYEGDAVTGEKHTQAGGPRGRTRGWADTAGSCSLKVGLQDPQAASSPLPCSD